MTQKLILTNARLVLENEVLQGSLVITDGKISDISAGNSTHGEDMGGDTIIPGLVELHTDHLESHYVPRPKVRWNPHAAVVAHDAQIAGCGITTVLDALRVGADEDAELGGPDIRLLSDAIRDNAANGILRADHLLHLRCEVSAPDCLDGFEYFEEDKRVKLVSLMDHAPGQRQFVSLEAYKIYYTGKKRMSEEEFETFCKRRVAESARYSNANRLAVAAACRARGVRLASHDDATSAHVVEAKEQGITIAEFPTTLEAAKASHEAGMSVLMGAPNLIRGGSHSGNISASALAANGHLDILSSDYIPFSLMSAAFKMNEVVPEITLPEAVNMVSRNPAAAIGLEDRGLIEIGRRGDLVRVSLHAPVPAVRSVWREGRRVM